MRIIITLLCLCIFSPNSYAFDLDDVLGKAKNILRDNIIKNENALLKEPGKPYYTLPGQATRAEAYYLRCKPIYTKCQDWASTKKNSVGKGWYKLRQICYKKNNCGDGHKYDKGQKVHRSKRIKKERAARDEKIKRVEVPKF